MLWSISGGAGFLGLHLARRLLADGHDVRTLDVVPLDDAELERTVEELRGDIRDRESVRELVDGADVVVHAAAALPIQASRESIRSVNVGGTENVLRAADDAGVRRVVFISSTAVYGVPEKHPIEEDDPLVGVGSYGESKIDAEGLCRVAAVETTIVRPKTFIGPERLGVFEILFDWIREGRRIYTLGKGDNRYQLLAVEDLVDAIVRAGNEPKAVRETFNVGATDFGTVRSDLQALIDHAGSSSRLQPVPVKPAEVALRTLELLKVSPLDRKSTRLNSSHSQISYAVFCLKKKKHLRDVFYSHVQLHRPRFHVLDLRLMLLTVDCLISFRLIHLSMPLRTPILLVLILLEPP